MDGAEERSGVMDFLIFVRERQAESEEVRVKAEEAWLTAKAVGTLLGADSTAVERQFRSLFATGELLERDVSARFLRTRKDGSKNEETFYSAAAVIALGLRMETPQARQFRRWAWDKLSNYAVKGWVLDKERLKGDRLFDAAYFEHLKRKFIFHVSEKERWPCLKFLVFQSHTPFSSVRKQDTKNVSCDAQPQTIVKP